jgi:hypothetical protein
MPFTFPKDTNNKAGAVKENTSGNGFHVPVVVYDRDGTTPVENPGNVNLVGSIAKDGTITQGSVVVAPGTTYQSPVQYIKGYDKLQATCWAQGTGINYVLYLTAGKLPTGHNPQATSASTKSESVSTGTLENIYPHVIVEVANQSSNPLTIRFLTIAVKG